MSSDDLKQLYLEKKNIYIFHLGQHRSNVSTFNESILKLIFVC